MVRMASAAEYVIDFSMITDFERLRPLIDYVSTSVPWSRTDRY